MTARNFLNANLAGPLSHDTAPTGQLWADADLAPAAHHPGDERRLIKRGLSETLRVSGQ